MKPKKTHKIQKHPKYKTPRVHIPKEFLEEHILIKKTDYRFNSLNASSFSINFPEIFENREVIT